MPQVQPQKGHRRQVRQADPRVAKAVDRHAVDVLADVLSFRVQPAQVGNDLLDERRHRLARLAPVGQAGGVAEVNDRLGRRDGAQRLDHRKSA